MRRKQLSFWPRSPTANWQRRMSYLGQSKRRGHLWVSSIQSIFHIVQKADGNRTSSSKQNVEEYPIVGIGWGMLEEICKKDKVYHFGYVYSLINHPDRTWFICYDRSKCQTSRRCRSYNAPSGISLLQYGVTIKLIVPIYTICRTS